MSRIKGINISIARKMLEIVGSEKEFFTMPIRELERLTGLGSRNFNDLMREAILDHARKQAAFAASHNIRLIYFTDEDYPCRLLECEDAPLVLFVKGDANLNARHTVGIVGTRNATHYGVDFINRLVDDLATKVDDLLIVSGLALGCDVTAHRRAMVCGVPTVGVLAHGLDTIYPAENRADAAKMAAGAGAVLTEYPTETRPFRGNFLARNRIVAGLSDALVVAESAASHGGALQTARLAREYNREVFAVPGRTTDVYSGGCNLLIQRNIAALCTGADDIIKSLQWEARAVEGEQRVLFREFSPEEQMIVDQLLRNGDMQMGQLTASTGMAAGRLMGLLMELEMDGVIISLPGSRYRLVKAQG